MGWYIVGKVKWDDGKMGKVLIFNVVDKGVIIQGIMVDIIGEVFGISMGFQGLLISIFVKFNFDSVVDDVNDEFLGLWVDFFVEVGIIRLGFLMFFMEKELLKDIDLSMDGLRLEEVVGFMYEKFKILKELVEEVIESYKKMKWWF